MTDRLSTRLAVIALLAAAAVVSAQGVPNPDGASACQQALIERFELLPVEPLSDLETAEILFLREEEKLARDVYLTLSLHWDLPLFDRIPRSEQQHMDLMMLLVARYQLVDPVGDHEIGVFTDPDLQALYFSLVEAGRGSLVEGLAVGALVEETDIADLITTIADTDNADIALIAHNLMAGSRNHLRAFVSALSKQGFDYVPQVLDPDAFAAILAAPREVAVVYDELGEVLARCARQAGPRAGAVRVGPGSGGGRIGPGEGGGSGDQGGGSGDQGGGNDGQGGGNDGQGGGNDGQGGGGQGTGSCDGTGPHGQGGST